MPRLIRIVHSINQLMIFSDKIADVRDFKSGLRAHSGRGGDRAERGGLPQPHPRRPAGLRPPDSDLGSSPLLAQLHRQPAEVLRGRPRGHQEALGARNLHHPRATPLVLRPWASRAAVFGGWSASLGVVGGQPGVRRTQSFKSGGLRGQFSVVPE